MVESAVLGLALYHCRRLVSSIAAFCKFAGGMLSEAASAASSMPSTLYFPMQILAVCKVHKLPTVPFCLTFISSSPTHRSCSLSLAISNTPCEASFALEPRLAPILPPFVSLEAWQVWHPDRQTACILRYA